MRMLTDIVAKVRKDELNAETFSEIIDYYETENELNPGALKASMLLEVAAVVVLSQMTPNGMDAEVDWFRWVSEVCTTLSDEEINAVISIPRILTSDGLRHLDDLDLDALSSVFYKFCDPITDEELDEIEATEE